MLSIESGRGVCFADELVLRRISLQLSDGLASVGERHHLMLALAEVPRAQIVDIGFKTRTREGSDTSVAWGSLDTAASCRRLGNRQRPGDVEPCRAKLRL
jgi:hypothetical protein